MTALKDKAPMKVERMIRSKLMVLSHDEESHLEFLFDLWANKILSYGGTIKGCKCNTIDKTEDKMFPKERHIIYLFYEVPINITREVLGQ